MIYRFALVAIGIITAFVTPALTQDQTDEASQHAPTVKYPEFYADLLERLEDGSFQYNGSLDLERYEWATRDLVEFWNDFHITVVNEDFKVANSNLVSLRGGPKTVKGFFNCSNNQIITLVDGPVDVGGEYDCSNNTLESLAGTPDTLRWSLDCSHNRIRSLHGGPSYIEKRLVIRHNLLTNLDGIPQFGQCGLCAGNQDVYDAEYDRGERASRIDGVYDYKYVRSDRTHQRPRPKVTLAPYSGSDPTPDMVPTTSMFSSDTVYCRSTAFGCFDATYNPVAFSDDQLWATGAYEWDWLFFAEWKDGNRRLVKKNVEKRSQRPTKSQTAR